MTTREMQRNVELKLRQMDNIPMAGMDRVQSYDIIAFLNEAHTNFVIETFNGPNPPDIQYFRSQSARDDLRTLLVKSAEITPNAAIPEIPNGREYTIPTDLMYMVKTYVNVGGAGAENWFSGEMISDKDSYEFIQTSKHLPYIREAKVVYENGTTLTVLVDPDVIANLENVKIMYLREPVDISLTVDSELPEHTHPRIVNIAADLIRRSFPQPPNMPIKGTEQLQQ